MEKKKLFQEATLYSASLFISRLLLSIRGIIIPKFLGPVQYGIYNGLLLIPDFLVHFHFGSLSALKREIPFCYGKKDFIQAQRIRNIVFCHYMGSILIAVLLIFLFTLFFKDHYSSMVIYSLWLLCPLIVFQSLVDGFFENLLRADNRFNIISNSEIFKALFGFILMIVMIWFWHIYGAIASLLLALILKGVYILSKTDYKFSWVWDFIELKRLLAIGFPIIFGLIMITFFNSIDRFVIIKYLDTRQLGYYSLGLTISKFLLIIQTGAYGVLEPKVYRLYGEKGEIGPLKNIIWEPLYFMSLFFPVILGLVYVGSPYLLYLFLPKYLPSLVCMQIMILGSFFFIFVDGTYTFIVAINRQGFIIKVIAIGIAVNLVINYLLVRWGWGIEGVALGTTGVNMFIGLIYLVFTLNHFFKEFRQKIVMTIKLFSPFVLVGILVVFMDYFWPARGVLKQEIGMIVLKGFVLLVLSAPFLWTAKKKIKIFIGSGG